LLIAWSRSKQELTAASSSVAIRWWTNPARSSNGTERIPTWKTGGARTTPSARANRFFAPAVDSIPGLVAIMTAEGEVECVNRKVLEYFGKTLDDLRHWGTSSLVHPNDLPNGVAARVRSNPGHRTKPSTACFAWTAYTGGLYAAVSASGWQRTHSPLAQLID